MTQLPLYLKSPMAAKTFLRFSEMEAVRFFRKYQKIGPYGGTVFVRYFPGAQMMCVWFN